MPITVLIGTIYTLARLAQTSQYTILPTGGLAPARALWLLTSLALVFGLFTYVVGDYVAPFSERLASQLRVGAKGYLYLGRSGAWIKEHTSGPTARRTTRSTSARPSAAACCTTSASSSSTPRVGCCRAPRRRAPRSAATAPGP